VDQAPGDRDRIVARRCRRRQENPVRSFAAYIRDLRTGEVHDTPGQTVRTCVSGAAGDVEIEL
jgi:hypothetical protein